MGLGDPRRRMGFDVEAGATGKYRAPITTTTWTTGTAAITQSSEMLYEKQDYDSDDGGARSSTGRDSCRDGTFHEVRGHSR